MEHGISVGIDVVIEILGEEVETKISLKLPGMTPTGQLYLISGFPRCLFRADAANLSRQSHDQPPEYSTDGEESLSRLTSKSVGSLTASEKLDLTKGFENLRTDSISMASTTEEASRVDSMSVAESKEEAASTRSGISE